MPLILPTTEKRTALRKINTLLRKYKESDSMKPLAEAVQIILTDESFGATIKLNTSLPKRYETAGDLMKLAWAYLYHFLSLRDYVAAAMILWDEETFTPEPGCVQLTWHALFTQRMIAIIGGSALGKTYSVSAFYLLEWLLDPEWTRIQIASASEDHLKRNLFADIVRLHEGAALALPGIPDSEGISLNKKAGMGIFTIVLPGGPNAKAKIKGAHTKPRPLHPIFGRRSRVFMLIDEGQEVPQNIFSDIPNRFATAMKGDVDHIKFVVCANPKDRTSAFGKACQPSGGFDSVTMDRDFWTSDEGWHVVSLNAMKHENVKQRRQVFPGFVSYEGVQVLLNKCHGDDQHPDMFTLVYGRFPPQGLLSTVIQRVHVEASYGDWIFDSGTEGAAGFDPAYTGDSPELATARTGRAIAWMGFDGKRHELAQPKIALQLDACGAIPRGDTQDMTDEVCPRLKQLNIKPDRYAQDKMQPISEPVLTPDGWRKIGEISVGDYVIGSSGIKTKVTGVYPQEDRRVMRVFFNDGSWTRCGPEHLWTVKNTRHKSPITVTTDALSFLIKNNKPKRWSIPLLSGAVEYSNISKLPIDPYVMGCLLGDGNLRKNGIRFSSIDAEILDRIRARLPDGLELMHQDRCDYTISSTKKPRDEFGRFYFGRNPMLDSLRDLGLSGALSHNKFIPKIYMQASADSRLALLRGLMDADGWVNSTHVKTKTSSCSIRLSSEKMTGQIAELVQSLGGIAKQRSHKTFLNGKEYRRAYLTTVSLPNNATPFLLSRKNEKLINRRDKITRFVDRIEKDIDEASVCIRVESEDHLYVTRNFILTHNTGNGIGTHDIIRRQWQKKVGTGGLPEDAAAPICGINYAESPTEIKIAEEDTETPKEMFDIIASELWYAGAKLFECDCVRIGRGIPLDAIEQLVSRLGGSKVSKGKKRSIESKKDYKARTGRSSPDKADAILITCHVARITTPGLIPKARDTKIEPPQRGPLFKEEEITETATSIAGWGDHQTLELMQD